VRQFGFFSFRLTNGTAGDAMTRRAEMPALSTLESACAF
jgi:hypothetical protein